MPGRKRNKYITIQKRAIKRRLIEISIRVDGYIYKDKTITIEEAEKYINEISVHQKRCNNDKHILQVIEKLTRCMKTIIEETPKRIQSLKKVATLKNYQCVDLIPESFSLSNKHKDFPKEASNENNSKKSDSANIFVISDSENEENVNKNVEELTVHNKDVNDKSKGSGNFSVYKIKNELKSSKLNTFYIQANNLEGNSKNAKKTKITQSNNKQDKNLNFFKSDQDNRSVDHKPKKNMNKTYKSITANSEIKRKYKKKVTKNVEDTQRTSMSPIHHNKSENYKKKKITDVSQKSLSQSQTLNFDASVNTVPQKLNKISKNNKNQVPKNNTGNDLPNKRKKASKKSDKYERSNLKEHNLQHSTIIAPVFPAPNKFKHTPVTVVHDEVALPVITVQSNEGSSILTNQDSVTEQMGALTIYNDHVLDDLSWIEGIRYVREVGNSEFIRTPNIFTDVFWNNCLLPNDWNDIDFLDIVHS